MSTSTLDRLMAALLPATATVEAAPLFPLRDDVWYKTRKGEFARRSGDMATEKHGDRVRKKFYYYKEKKEESRYDWWFVFADNGRRSYGDETNDDNIVAYADEPALQAGASFLPLCIGVEYRTKIGAKVKIVGGPDSDGDMHTEDIVGVSRYWRAYDGKHRGALGPSGYGTEHDIIGLWAEPITKATPPPGETSAKLPDASALIASLLALNRDTIEAAARVAADGALATYKAQTQRELVAEIAKAVEQPIAAMVAEKAAQSAIVREIVIRDQQETRVVASPHPKLAEAVEISRAINNVWLCGPAGSGKTTLAHQLADALGLPYSFISCTAGMSEAKLLGRMNVQGAYLPAEFVRIYEEGGVFLWDEFDAADPNVVLCANAAMANGHLSVPDRVDRPVATRHPSTILVVATNTWGRGSTSECTARETLDAATRDRFVLSKIEVDYAPSIEWQFLGGYDAPTATPWKAPTFSATLPNVFAKVRANIVKHHLRRVMSTRAFAQAAALRALGWTDQQIVERYFLDWTEQERAKALEGVC